MPATPKSPVATVDEKVAKPPAKDATDAMAKGYFNLDDVPADRAESSDMQETIELAEELLVQKADLLDEIDTARKLLHMQAKMKKGSRDQIMWLRFNLPQKVRASKATAEVADVPANGDDDDE